MNDKLEKITAQARTALGENLVALVLYGSHARGEAAPRSDVNLLMVVRDQSSGALMKLQDIMPGWIKQTIAPPVILQQDQIAKSLDSFAIEFAEIAAARQTLFGDDPFADFRPDWAAVRRELEQEARQKRIALVRRWLAAAGKDKALRAAIAETVPGYLTLLRSTLMLKQQLAVARKTDEVFAALSEKSWFKRDVWTRLRETAQGKSKPAGAELAALLHDYLEQAAALIKRLDDMD